jgi:structure-specific recognition protein 1
VGGGVASARTFDMRVVSKTDNVDHVFSAISKEEVQPISTFLQSKNVRLKNEMEEVMDIEPISDDDEEDDDVSIPSEDERPRKSKDKTGKKPARANDDDRSPDPHQMVDPPQNLNQATSRTEALQTQVIQ